MLQTIKLKKNTDRRIRGGFPWVYSNEVDVKLTPLHTFTPGQQVQIQTHDGTFLGNAYVNPHSLISARIFSREPKILLDENLLIARLNEALKLRELIFDEPYYRLIFSEGDQLPGLILDRFGDHLVAQLNTAGMDRCRDALAASIQAVLPTVQSILLRNDSSSREQEGLPLATAALLGTPPQTVELIENKVKFLAPLWDGQKTGWFYDHRLNRARLTNYVKNKSVLDVFSYLGGWGIQAAVAGAKHVDCLDASAFACEFVAKNAALNELNNVQVICDDAFDGLKSLLKQGKTYEVIVLDPPAFVKRSKDHQAGVVAYQRLNELALKLLEPDGLLVFCSCSMHLSVEDMMGILQRSAYRTQCELAILERGHQGPDHPIHLLLPAADYLKAIFVRKIS